jgi:hypothetical protein
MRPWDWFKIVLGMLAIFTVGLVAVRGINAAKDNVVHFVESDAPITVPMFGTPFRTAKGALGKIQQLRIERESARVIDGFHLTVALDDGVDVDQFDACEVTIVDASEIDEDTEFTCLTAADPAFDDLVQFGNITFRPSGEVHRLMVPSAVRDDIRAAFQDGEAAGDSVAVNAADGDGKVVIKINGKRIVDIGGDSSGGHLIIRDPNTGEKVVDITGTP